MAQYSFGPHGIRAQQAGIQIQAPSHHTDCSVHVPPGSSAV